MKTLIMTGSSFTGQVIFEYNTAGQLYKLHIDAELGEKQYNYIYNKMPRTLADIEPFCTDTKNAVFSLSDSDITFDMFCNLYYDKIRSSKAKTRKQWEKMPKAEQVKAYCYIPVYLKNKGEAALKYATTYLSDELWNN
jgi:hypothetical protein